MSSNVQFSGNAQAAMDHALKSLHSGESVRDGMTAIGFDAECLRAKCEDDPRTGYQMLKRFAGVMFSRLQGAHLQLLDVYGRPEGT